MASFWNQSPLIHNNTITTRIFCAFDVYIHKMNIRHFRTVPRNCWCVSIWCQHGRGKFNIGIILCSRKLILTYLPNIILTREAFMNSDAMTKLLSIIILLRQITSIKFMFIVVNTLEHYTTKVSMYFLSVGYTSAKETK